jgi:hypothetical protein
MSISLWPTRSALALTLLALAAVGCQRSPSGGTSGPTQAGGNGIVAPDAQQPVVATAAPVASPTFPPPPPDEAEGRAGAVETWESFAMWGGGESVRVGYSRTIVSKAAGPGGQEVIRTSNFTRTVMERAGQSIQQDMQMISLDTPDGRLVAFETRMPSGGGQIVTTGAVRGSQLEMQIASPGRTERQSIPWQAEWGGLFAAEQSTRRQPLMPGEKRTVRGLVPMLNVAGDTLLAAGDYETAPLPGGPRRLLRVDAAVQMGTQTIHSTHWADERGETLKTIIPAVGQESIRTTKEDALRQSPGGRLDLLVSSTVPLAGELPNPQQTKRVVYRARVKSGTIAGLFAECPSQQVKQIDERTAEITVTSIRPDKVAGTLRVPSFENGLTTADDGTRSVPTTLDLAASSYIQSDDPAIVQLAASVAPSETDVWKLVCALEKFVDQTIREKNFSQAFATAGEVARSLEGDCTEHAVLFAALCRARKVPARCAFGLVYYPPLKGFAFHMWNEVWIGDRWIPMDATLGQGGIAADHLKLGDTSLSGASPLAELLGVIPAFGRLELEVLRAN